MCQSRNSVDTVQRHFYEEGFHSTTNSASIYYIKDHLGSVHEGVDDYDGTFFYLTFCFEPYGLFCRASQATPYMNYFIYAGMFYLPEAELYLTRHRAYDPRGRRWLSRDPIEEAGGINLYGYVEGNPVNFNDPLGLEPICAPDGQKTKCSDGMRSPPEGTPLNGPLSPIGIGSTAVEMCPVPFIKVPWFRKIPGDVYKKIQTGRTAPNNLKEKLAMEEVMSNPQGSTPPRIPKMSDTKNGFLAEDGWVKRVQNVNGVEIHYIENTRTGETLDFKFK